MSWIRWEIPWDVPAGTRTKEEHARTTIRWEHRYQKEECWKEKMTFHMGELCLLRCDVASFYTGHRRNRFEHQEPIFNTIDDHACLLTSKTMNTLTLEPNLCSLDWRLKCKSCGRNLRCLYICKQLARSIWASLRMMLSEEADGPPRREVGCGRTKGSPHNIDW